MMMVMVMLLKRTKSCRKYTELQDFYSTVIMITNEKVHMGIKTKTTNESQTKPKRRAQCEKMKKMFMLTMMKWLKTEKLMPYDGY